MPSLHDEPAFWCPLGSNTLHHRYWGQGNYVWNNDGDTAKLRRANGTLADQCSYSGAGSYVFC